MILDDADGLIAFQIRTTTGETHDATIDLCTANDLFLRASDGADADQPADYFAKLRTTCQELGLPPVSGATALKIRQAVFERMESLRKKDREAESVT